MISQKLDGGVGVWCKKKTKNNCDFEKKIVYYRREWQKQGVISDFLGGGGGRFLQKWGGGGAFWVIVHLFKYIWGSYLIYLRMKKIKGPFWWPSICPSVQPVTTRAGALVLRFEHWTPKGDCKVVATKKEKKITKKKFTKNWNHLQFHIINAFKNESGQKKVHQKI